MGNQKLIVFIVMNSAASDTNEIFYDAVEALNVARKLGGTLYQAELTEMNFRSRRRKNRNAND